MTLSLQKTKNQYKHTDFLIIEVFVLIPLVLPLQNRYFVDLVLV